MAVRSPSTIPVKYFPFSAALAVSIAAGSAIGEPSQFDHQGVELRAHIPLFEFGSNVLGGNDCWGYVSPSGREYALMGLRKALAVVEITTPTAPVIVGSIPHPSSLWADVKVFGDHAFVVNENSGGVQSIDLSNVDAGEVSLAGTFFDDSIPRSHNIAVNEDSGFGYLLGSVTVGQGLVAVDLSDPLNLTIAGEWNTGVAVHDAEIVTYDEGPYAGREIAYCFAGHDGLVILDVTDKSAMFVISSMLYPNLGFAHQGWLDRERQLVYLNDELDELNGLVATTTTRVFDVSDLENPVLRNAFTNGVEAIDHNLYVRDGVIYEANYTSGLRIYDARNIADAINPPEIAFFDTSPSAAELGIEHEDQPPDQGSFSFSGAWSVYPFFPSGIVIVSDLENGLFILDPSEALDAGNPADLNGDGVVNGVDLAALLAAWGTAGASDLNDDAVTDGADLAILLANWG